MRKSLSLFAEKVLIPAVLLAGGAARIVTWFQDRSLFIDEANLARNICEKSWSELFGPLNYDQYAPPLFCIFCKLFTQAFGNSELALRAFPLLCGLTSLILFYYVAKQLISNTWVLLITLWIFSFSEMQVRYTTECKQYICDVTLALILASFTLWQLKYKLQVWMSVIVGIISPWLSMPVIFVLGGAGIALLRNGWKTKDRRAIIGTLVSGFAWLFSFTVYYFLNLRKSIGTDSLTQYHQPYFFPLLPSSKQELLQGMTLLKAFPYNTSGYTVVALIAGSLGLLVGIIYSFRKRISVFLLFTLPVLFCLGASGLQLYSIVPRLILWAFTFLLLVQGMGWQLIVSRTPRYLLPLAAILLIAPVGLQNGWKVFYQPMQIEEIRPVLDNVSKRFLPNDILYVHHEAWPAVAYYRNCYLHSENYQFGGRIIQGRWDSRPEEQVLVSENQKPERVWLVYSHVVSESTRREVEGDLQVIGGYAHQIDSVVAQGAVAYLYQF